MNQTEQDVRQFLANLRVAAWQRQTVIVAGGEFPPTMLYSVANALEEWFDSKNERDSK